MATHSSILAWRIPWAEEPGGYSPWDHKELNTAEATEHAHSHALKWYQDSEEGVCVCGGCVCVCVCRGWISKFYDLSDDSWAKLRISLFIELQELFFLKKINLKIL